MSPRDKRPSLLTAIRNRIKITRTVQPIVTHKVPEPDPWEEFKKRCRSLHSPLNEIANSLIGHIEFYEDTAKDYKEFDDLRTHFEASFANMKWTWRKVWSGSVHSMCRSIMVEIGRLPGKEGRKVLHVEAESDVGMRDVLERYARIGNLLKCLSLETNSYTWDSLDIRHRLSQQLFPSVLSSIDRVYELDVPHVRPLGRHLPNKEVDSLAQILSWIDASATRSFYWMSSTEVTNIASSLCEELKSRSTLAATFCCSQNYLKCRDANNIIPRIAYQLAMFSHRFYVGLRRALEYYTWGPHNHSVEQQFQDLIVKPFEQARLAFPTNTVIVIEALETCEGRELAVQLLLLFVKVDLPFRLVIFSQPNPNLQARLEELDANWLSYAVLHDLDNATVRTDIKAYLETNLVSFGPSSREVTHLVERAGNSVNYATTAVRYLNNSRFPRSTIKRLDLILRASVPTSSPDAEIDVLCGAVLQEVFERLNRDAEVETRMGHVLDTIACARELLTSKQIADLLELDHSQVVFSLDQLQPVIHVMGYHGRVTLLHTQFSDFLLDPHRSKKHYRDPHNFLARHCFDSLDEGKKFNICGLQSAYVLDTEVGSLSNLIRKNITRRMAYACQHWAAHMHASAEITGLEKRLEAFLTNNLLLWLEILNLTKNVDKGPKIIELAEQWAIQHATSLQTVELAKAASRFVVSFASSSISQSTPHIYVSMLPSLPALDPIRTIYGRRIRGAIRITGTAVDQSLVFLVKGFTDGQVYSAAFAPDSRRIALGAGNDVLIVDASSGRLMVEPFKGHTWSVMSVVFSPDGARIASGSRDRTIRIWDSQTGDLLMGPLTGHTSHIRSVAFAPSGTCIVSGSNDTTIRVWNVQTGQLKLDPLSGHTDYVKSIAIFSDGSRIVSGSKDGTMRIWDLRTGDLLLGPLLGHTDYIATVSLSPDNSRIVSGSADGTIRIWNSQTGRVLLGPLVGHSDWVLSVAFTADCAHMLSSSSDRTICLWDATTGRLVAEPLRAHKSHVYSVQCSPGGSHFVSCGGDETFGLWKAPTTGSKPPEPSPGHSQAVRSICLSPNGTHLVSGSSDHSICVWDLQNKLMIIGPLVFHRGAVNSVCFSHDGKTIVSGSDDGTIHILDGETGAPVMIFDPPDSRAPRVNSVACASKKSLIVSGASNGTLCVWSHNIGELILGPIKLHNEAVQILSAKFSPDDTRIVTGSSDQTIYILDAITGTVLLGPLLGHRGAVRSVRFSPDGTQIVSGSEDKTVRIWNTQTGELIRELEGARGTVLCVEFSPEGALIASGCADYTTCVWEAASGEMILRPLTGHTGSVNSVAFLPGGKHVVSASSDTVIRVWDVQTRYRPLSDFHFRGPTWTMDKEGWILEYLSEGEWVREWRDEWHPGRWRGTRNSEQERESKRRVEWIQGLGWMRKSNNWCGKLRCARLAWVNPELRTSLLAPRNTALFSRSGYVKLDVRGAEIGEAWPRIYQPE